MSATQTNEKPVPVVLGCCSAFRLRQLAQYMCQDALKGLDLVLLVNDINLSRGETQAIKSEFRTWKDRYGLNSATRINASNTYMHVINQAAFKSDRDFKIRLFGRYTFAFKWTMPIYMHDVLGLDALFFLDDDIIICKPLLSLLQKFDRQEYWIKNNPLHMYRYPLKNEPEFLIKLFPDVKVNTDSLNEKYFKLVSEPYAWRKDPGLISEDPPIAMNAGSFVMPWSEDYRTCFDRFMSNAWFVQNVDRYPHFFGKNTRFQAFDQGFLNFFFLHKGKETGKLRYLDDDVVILNYDNPRDVLAKDPYIVHVVQAKFVHKAQEMAAAHQLVISKLKTG